MTQLMRVWEDTRNEHKFVRVWEDTYDRGPFKRVSEDPDNDDRVDACLERQIMMTSLMRGPPSPPPPSHSCPPRRPRQQDEGVRARRADSISNL